MQHHFQLSLVFSPKWHWMNTQGKSEENGEITGPWERWRATGKGRTESLGGAVGGGGLSEIPFSTIEPIKLFETTPSSPPIWSELAPKTLERDEALESLRLVFCFLSITEWASEWESERCGVCEEKGLWSRGKKRERWGERGFVKTWTWRGLNLLYRLIKVFFFLEIRWWKMTFNYDMLGKNY